MTVVAFLMIGSVLMEKGNKMEVNNRKQVIYDIERCICHVPDACRDCSKYKEGQPLVICMEELLKDALILLKEQEDLEKKYTSLLEEKISELEKENAKLNLEMNQTISEWSLYTVDRWGSENLK